MITREPVSRQAKAGAKVVLRVSASGNPSPTYQWFHDGRLIPGADSDRLTIPAAGPADEGGYHCEATSIAGVATSRACTLSLLADEVPKPVIGPEVSTLREGQPLTLKVLAPPPERLQGLAIHWTLNGARIKGAQGPELRITAAQKEHEGQYKAMISVGSSLEASNVAKVAVGAKCAVPPARPQPPPLPSARAPAPQAWEELFFNPEEEREDAGKAQPLPLLQEAPRAKPGPQRKKELLEKLLLRWQERTGRRGAKAA